MVLHVYKTCWYDAGKPRGSGLSSAPGCWVLLRDATSSCVTSLWDKELARWEDAVRLIYCRQGDDLLPGEGWFYQSLNKNKASPWQLLYRSSPTQEAPPKHSGRNLEEGEGAAGPPEAQRGQSLGFPTPPARARWALSSLSPQNEIFQQPGCKTQTSSRISEFDGITLISQHKQHLI